jgi:hypothetical protein
MKRLRYSVRELQLLLSCILFSLSISAPHPVTAQTVPYARTFAKSSEEVDSALKEMQAYAGQKLPIVDGFVAHADQPLDRYERAFYQFSIDLLPAGSGGTVVRVTAKITAWYADRDPWKSGYQVLPSNGRLELDLLDRLSEKFGSKPSSSTLGSDLQAPKPKLDLSPGLSRSPLPSNPAPTATSTHSSEATSGGLGGDEIIALRAKRQAEENRMRQLNTELQSLQEIQRNQAHPQNLVVVKKSGTPVLTKPAEGSQLLFNASADDEFEFIEAVGEWIHVQISGLSRGYIRRSNLDLPEYIAARLKSSNGTDANEKQGAFRIKREETSNFPGNWEALRGKPVKIYTVQPVSQDSKETSMTAKLNFAFSLFQKFSADSTGSTPVVEGVVVIFDSADGGIIGATLANVEQMRRGSLSRDNFWKLCYLDPPETFQPTSKP